MAEVFLFKKDATEPCYLLIYRLKGARPDPDRRKLKMKAWGKEMEMAKEFIEEGLTKEPTGEEYGKTVIQFYKSIQPNIPYIRMTHPK